MLNNREYAFTFTTPSPDREQVPREDIEHVHRAEITSQLQLLELATYFKAKFDKKVAAALKNGWIKSEFPGMCTDYITVIFTPY